MVEFTLGVCGLCPVLLILGLHYLGISLRPAREGTTPYCSQCDYNLTGRAGGRCPECGTAASKETIVFGERQIQPASVVLGSVLLLIALLIITPAAFLAYSGIGC